MKVSQAILTILFFTICDIGFSQKIQRKEFKRSEMITMVNGEVYKNSLVGRSCNLTINYRERAYYFDCISAFNPKKIYQTFKVVESKDGQFYAEFSFDLSEEKSRYLIADSINEKGKIEFIELMHLEDGTPVTLTYRFSK
jgi:hypothetical protein